MITLTAEIICDTCKRVVASGNPAVTGNIEVFSAIADAVNKAKRHGAVIGFSTVTCADCLEKQMQGFVLGTERQG